MGSCELSIVDPDGNWVQMMNTGQTGGIPGEVVDGVPMVGSHVTSDMSQGLAGWIVEGSRVRSLIGHTFVFQEGRPWMSLGTPGSPWITVPQVLVNLLDYGLEPYAAIDAPRMNPITDEYEVGIESRLAAHVPADLARMGVLIKPHARYDWHMGSFQMAWRDKGTGLLSSTCDPRRAGVAAGF